MLLRQRSRALRNKSDRALKLLQPRPLRRVLDSPAFRFQFIANRIAAFEIFCFACCLTLFEQCEQLRRRVLLARCAKPENRINLMPRGERSCSTLWRKGIARQRFVRVAHPIINGGPCGTNVQIFVECRSELPYEWIVPQRAAGGTPASDFTQLAKTFINSRQG